MSQIQRSELQAVIGKGQAQRAVVWPIERATEKAWLITTAGGQIWVPKYLWRDDHLRSPESRIKWLMELFEKISSTHDQSTVPVKKVGDGTTEKSVKVRFRVRREINDPRNPDYKEAVRSATVPASLLVQDEKGIWSLPQWCLRQKLKDTERLVDKPIWPGLAAVRTQLENGLATSLKLQAEQELKDSLERERTRKDPPVLNVVVLIPQTWLSQMGIAEQLNEDELKNALKALLVHLLSSTLDDKARAQLAQSPVEPSGECKFVRVSLSLQAASANVLKALAQSLGLTPGPMAKRLLGLAANSHPQNPII